MCAYFDARQYGVPRATLYFSWSCWLSAFSRSVLRAERISLHPASANLQAQASPIPELAPAAWVHVSSDTTEDWHCTPCSVSGQCIFATQAHIVPMTHPSGECTGWRFVLSGCGKARILEQGGLCRHTEAGQTRKLLITLHLLCLVLPDCAMCAAVYRCAMNHL